MLQKYCNIGKISFIPQAFILVLAKINTKQATYSVLINDINDYQKLSLKFSSIYQGYTAWLNKSCENLIER